MITDRISFMNELANLAEKLEANIQHFYNGISFDQRIGCGFLYTACGYDSSYFQKTKVLLNELLKNLHFI